MAVELSILSSRAFRAGVFMDIAHVEVRNVAAVDNHVSTFAIVSDDGANTTNTLSRCPRFGAVAWKYGS